MIVEIDHIPMKGGAGRAGGFDDVLLIVPSTTPLVPILSLN